MTSASAPTLILASRSPRRRQLLAEAGFAVVAIDPPFVDPAHPESDVADQDPVLLAAELARQKLQSVHQFPDLIPKAPAVILTADTISLAPDGRLFGSPLTEHEARAMIEAFAGQAHQVITGVALSDAGNQRHEFWADVATVTLGTVDPTRLAEYLATGAWRGKAGGYNLTQVEAAGWPIRVDGDRDTVVGLPMQRLVPRLAEWGVLPRGDGRPR